MKSEFTETFDLMIQKTKGERFQQSKEITNINSNLMLVSTLNEKVCKYFSFTDPEIKPVYENLSQIYLYLISNCLEMY